MKADAYGSCLCGAVHFEVKGSFDSFFLCHCKYCQKDTGSAHGANLFSTSAELVWAKGESHVKQFQLPATRHTRSFCVNCGSALPGMLMNGKLLMVPAGSLDSAMSLRPTAHLFMASKACWDESLDSVPELAGLPAS